MKSITAAAAIVLLTTPAAFASVQTEAKIELSGWSRAAARYEEECGAGKLREQMTKAQAVPAYECFAKIIDEEIKLQYPDLYAALDTKMKVAHENYGSGKVNWDTTLKKLGEASDEYNEAVAQRNKHAESAMND
jgi:hypothetical protein